MARAESVGRREALEQRTSAHSLKLLRHGVCALSQCRSACSTKLPTCVVSEELVCWYPREGALRQPGHSLCLEKRNFSHPGTDLMRKAETHGEAQAHPFGERVGNVNVDADEDVSGVPRP